MITFSQSGIYYFSMHIENHHKKKTKKSSTSQLAVIVLPKIQSHIKYIRENHFDSEVIIITNTDDFVIWQFEQIISRNVVPFKSDATLEDILLCHKKAERVKNRRCLAVSCKNLLRGTYFFCNPGK